MQLTNKTAVIYGAVGAVGSTVARAFANEGARVIVTGRNLDKLKELANAIGHGAEAAKIDALDEAAVEKHAAGVGAIDITFNAIGIAQQGIQGIPLLDLPIESFSLPIATYTRAHLITARAAARTMIATKRGGVILMHTPNPARMSTPLVGGMAMAWGSIEALTRNLSAELASHGIRAICLRTTGMPETSTIDIVYGLHAKATGMTVAQFHALMESMGHIRRSTTLAELANAAVFAASERASGLTGTTLNLTVGRAAD
jgi:NAD(P)-dependent dehydrogenase (short-subunit alcohol dehydrogenase family)